MKETLRVTNDRSGFVTLWLEPWGEDYGMLPGDEFEIVAGDAAAGFYFHVIAEDKCTKVYAEGRLRKSPSIRVALNSRAATIGAKKLGNVVSEA